MVRGASIGLGTRAILEDLGIKGEIGRKTDASAAVGIASRRGVGKVRHIEVNQLWRQDRVAKKDLEIKKVKGESNIADAMTKYISTDNPARHMERGRQEIVAGRHEIIPEA